MAPRAEKQKGSGQASSEAAPSQTPATETPATETPATETPATETPATETPATETPGPAGPDDSAPKVERKGPEDLLTLMRKPVFQNWLKEHAAAAEKVLVSGPAGGGWRYNESKRQDAEDFAAALRGLRAAIEGASSGSDTDED